VDAGAVHRNQELEGLSRMSFVILQAVMKRLEERRKARLFAEMGSTMKLPRSARVGCRSRSGWPITSAADDPVPEYLEKRQGSRPPWTNRR
jgi:hypothetical protein